MQVTERHPARPLTLTLLCLFTDELIRGPAWLELLNPAEVFGRLLRRSLAQRWLTIHSLHR